MNEDVSIRALVVMDEVMDKFGHESHMLSSGFDSEVALIGELRLCISGTARNRRCLA
jgi:hypothetical protein